MKLLHMLVIVAVVILANACAVHVKDEMVVSPSAEIDQSNLAELIESGYTATEVSSDGEALYALQKVHPEVERTILVLHGNALNLSLQPWFGLLQSLAEIDANILAIDYQGFGSSSGVASFSNMQKDAAAALDSIPEGQDVYVYGLSLASVMAAEIGGDDRVKGLIIEGGITNTREMVALFKSKKFLGSLFTVEVDDTLQFDNPRTLAALEKPILVIHGKNDKNVPFGFGERLFAATNGMGEFYPVVGGGHCDTFKIEEETFLTRLGTFIGD